MSTYDTVIHHTIEDVAHELYSVHPEVNVPHLVFTLLAVFILFFGMFSALIKERLYVGEAIVATGFGIAFGPYAADLINPRSWGNPSFDDITLEFTRIVLALSVFAVGVELPRAYVKRHWRSLIVILGPLMIIGWLVTAAFIYALIPGLSFLGALVIAACATPTDPILAASVVGKGKFAQKHVPSHIRHLLQCESGCNDGAAFPFLYLALFLNFRESHSVGQAIGWWIVLVILYQIILGVIIGVAVGIAARKVLKFSKRRALIDRESMIAMYVSLAIFTTAVTTLAGSDDLLAAFACGAAFAWDDWFSESIEDSNFSNVIDLLVNCATFIYIGATMPFADWNNSAITIVPWRLIVIGILVLLFRRLPAMLLMYKWIPDIKTFREAVFAGWFGPMGVGAIFIATLALTKLPTPNEPPTTPDDFLALTIQPIIYFIVLCSIIVHGSSIPFFNLGKRAHSRVNSMSRTWTNRSDSEPSWLSRVKRVGDGEANILVNRDDGDNQNAGNGSSSEKEKRSGEKGRDLDLEAGETAIDDPGMDVGDMTSRDFADNKRSEKKRGGAGMLGMMPKSDSPGGSSDDTVQGSGSDDKGKDRASPQSENEKHSRRMERHDSPTPEEEDEWQEGDDIVRETHDGEDTEIIHKDGSREGGHTWEAAHAETRDGRRKDQSGSSEGREENESVGPGFPGGHRMQEIAAMLGRGHGLAHEEHEQTSAATLAAKAEGSRGRQDERPGKQLLENATERVVQDEEHEAAASRSRSRSHTGSVIAWSNARENEQRELEEAQEREGGDEMAPLPNDASEHQQGGAVPNARPSGLLSTAGSFLSRPKNPSRPTLTAEEKYARDAWCRRERHDVDDDEVKSWVQGNHLVIERRSKRGGGEEAEVEVVDANPSAEARDHARQDPELRVRSVPISSINAAKGDIAKEDSQGRTDKQGSGESTGQPHRFDLKSIRNNASFRRFFGGDGQAGKESITNKRVDAPSGSRQGRNADGDSKGVSFAQSTTGDAPREEGKPSSKRMTQQQQGTSSGSGGGESSSTPNYLSTRNLKTGIALDRTDTTDSQVRFGHLPVPRRN